MSAFDWKSRLVNWQPRWSPRVYRTALGSLVVLAFVIPLAIVALPFIEFLNGMAAQPKAKSQMTFGRVFGEERLVDRSLVPNTVAQDQHRSPLEGGTNKIEDAKAIGGRLSNPVPLTMDAMRAGRKHYETYCIVCHGAKGDGSGSAVGPNRFPAPPSLHTEQARGYSDGTIYYITSKGVGKMPGYAGQMEPQERWETIHFLRALQRAHNPRPEDLKP